MSESHETPFVPNTALRLAFMGILPRIKTHARIYFRHVRCGQRKADFIAETVALSWKWFVRLAERGKDATQFPSTLASYAARAVRSGRRVCGQLPAKDAMSERAQQKHGFTVQPLPFSTRTSHDHLNGIGGQRRHDEFEERLRDNTRTAPDEQAAFRIDFPRWVRLHCRRDRAIIKDMMANERTKDIARRHDLSQARVSQLRREWAVEWKVFTADPGVQQ